MPATEDRAISEFPRALQLLATALIEVSNPDGLGAYDTNSVELTELGRVILGVQYTQQLGNVSVFDAIKNTRVLSGTTTPTAIEGANGQLYVKYETVSNVDNVVGMYFKKDGAWLEISLGGGGGASVTLGTTVPSDASGENGDLYVQYDSSTYAVVEYFVKVNDSWRKAPYSRVVSLTQAQYDLITPDPTTLYIITDAQSSYQTKSDNSLDTEAKTVSGAINELHGVDGYDVYDNTATYAVGDVCIHSNSLQVCTTAVTVAEDFDSNKWSPTTIKALLALKANSSDFIYDIQTVVFDSSGIGTITSPSGYIALGAILDNNWFVAVMSNTAVIAHNRFDYTQLIKSTSVSIGVFFVKFS